MKEDPLTDILTLASARCVEVGILVAGGSWALRFPPPRRIKFVAVVKGDCWLSLDGEGAPLRITAGDVFVLPADRPFVIAGDLNAPQADGLGMFLDAPDKTAKLGDGDRFFRRWSAHRLGSRTRRAPLGGVAASPSHGQRLVRSLSHAMAPGSACEGGRLRSAGGGVGVEAAGAALVRSGHPVLPRGRWPSTGWMDPSPRRRAHRPGPSPHAPGARAGLATRRAGKGGGHVANHLCHPLQVHCGCPASDLPANLRMRHAEHGLREGAMSVSAAGPFAGLLFRERVQQRVQAQHGNGPQALPIHLREEGSARLRPASSHRRRKAPRH